MTTTNSTSGQDKSSNFMLSDMWRPERVADFKVHYARRNSEYQPLDVFTRSFDEWRSWQEYFPGKNDFNRPYVFSVIQIPDAPDTWLFGGIWKMLDIALHEDGSKSYDVELDDELTPLVGRLLLHRVHRQRGTRLNMESHYNDFIVHQVFPKRFTGRQFPGYDNVHVAFPELEALIVNRRMDWIAPLRIIKGVYLIRDTKTGRSYVGSAYGDQGIWSRWVDYSALGHGGNLGMRELLQKHDLEYCRQYFSFTLLEHFDARTEDQTIIDRESYWKKVLGTRHIERGLNRN